MATSCFVLSSLQVILCSPSIHPSVQQLFLIPVLSRRCFPVQMETHTSECVCVVMHSVCQTLTCSCLQANLVAAFEQSLALMTARLQSLSVTSEQKVSLHQLFLLHWWGTKFFCCIGGGSKFFVMLEGGTNFLLHWTKFFCCVGEGAKFLVTLEGGPNFLLRWRREQIFCCIGPNFFVALEGGPNFLLHWRGDQINIGLIKLIKGIK